MSRSWLLLVPLAGAMALGCSRPAPPKPTPKPVGMMPTPWMAPAVIKPPVKSAADAGLKDGEPVVGVVVGGKARAYSLPALSHISRHVVNDLLGETPVTVTYCDLADCLRVYTDGSKRDALELSQAGRGSDGLLLMFGGMTYSQSSGEASATGAAPLPLQVLPHEKTTWKAWRDKHPDTEVYTGP